MDVWNQNIKIFKEYLFILRNSENIVSIIIIIKQTYSKFNHSNNFNSQTNKCLEQYQTN